MACSSGLTVAGTGMLRPGTVRGPAVALAALCAASSMSNSAAAMRRPAASCASAGMVSAKASAIGTTPESDTSFNLFSPSPNAAIA